jgi:hypothetical protein
LNAFRRLTALHLDTGAAADFVDELDAGQLKRQSKHRKGRLRHPAP